MKAKTVKLTFPQFNAVQVALDNLLEQLEDGEGDAWKIKTTKEAIEIFKDGISWNNRDESGKRYNEEGVRMTNCCGVYSTYHNKELCCKKCWNIVDFGEGDGTEKK